ncbi:DUF2318 domain-containing protein [Geomonas sp. Red32]|uniref:DUF2318 domain-containing protein n=1 Tax=Geomonas sp. Red32 TaxID=2912856 RepID=UPI00202CEC76|nr:DUF2318 domain-containing protein [Geomonas sp. Red32]MCM0083578.1 DUF2318 domain-containing protein [Geomonas sp. Red32]
MATTNSKKTAVVAAMVVAVLVTVVTAFAFSFPGMGKAQQVKAASGVVSIPLSKVADGKAHFYRFDDGGKAISFVVAKGSDGSYHTAFDACDTCFASKKGYEQKGDKLECQNCRRLFAINQIGPHAVGGCNPSYVPSKTTSSAVTITVADLRTGARFF